MNIPRIRFPLFFLLILITFPGLNSAEFSRESEHLKVDVFQKLTSDHNSISLLFRITIEEDIFIHSAEVEDIMIRKTELNIFPGKYFVIDKIKWPESEEINLYDDVYAKIYRGVIYIEATLTRTGESAPNPVEIKYEFNFQANTDSEAFPPDTIENTFKPNINM